MNKLLSLNNISKTFYNLKGKIEAIKDISFDVYQGEIIGIVGSSGCGKSTLLNIIDELDKDYKGNIIKENIKMTYMLQSDALLPWLSVLDNALIGLKLENNITDKNINYVKELLIKFGLEKFINHKPTELSGGMKQRVA